MKRLKYILLLVGMVACWVSCKEEETEPDTVFARGPVEFRFYNNGDSVLRSMYLSTVLYSPIGYLIQSRSEAKHKNYSEYGHLDPFDVLTTTLRYSYVECVRYAKFTALYENKDDTSPYSLFRVYEYIILDTIKKEYVMDEYIYPDQKPIIVTWPEDSLLFRKSTNINQI